MVKTATFGSKFPIATFENTSNGYCLDTDGLDFKPSSISFKAMF
jgi:hypothetical protein